MRSTCLLLVFGALGVAVQAGSDYDVTAWSGRSADEPIIDMARLAEYPVPSAVQQSFDIINSIQGLPSCHRMAADALIDSCATFKAPTSPSGHGMTASSDPLLNAEHSLYAARMTACDLERDQLPVSDACRDFLPTQRTTRKRVLKGFFTSSGASEPTNAYPDYEAITTVQLPRCVKALYNEGKGQGWTAYIANFHGAKVTCNAMRTDIDKDEQINLMKVLLRTTADVDGVLAASRDEMSRMAQQVTQVQVQAREYLVKLHGSQADFRDIAARYMADLQALADERLEQMAASFQRVQVEADLTVDIVKGGNREILDSMSRTEGDLVERSLAQVQAMDVAHAYGIETVRELAAFFHEQYMQSIEQALGKAAQQMQDTLANATVGFRNTTDTMQQELDEAVHKAKLLNGAIVPWLIPGLRFLGYTIFFALFSFAAWQWVFTSLRPSGVISLSLGCGAIPGYVCSIIGDPPKVVTYISECVHASPVFIYVFIGIALTTLASMMAIGYGLRVSAFNRHHDDNEEQWIRERGLPSSQPQMATHFRLPVNDPRYMAEKQASFKRWQV